LPLYGDGQDMRDCIHVEDHARARLQVREHEYGRELGNISASKSQPNEGSAEGILDARMADIYTSASGPTEHDLTVSRSPWLVGLDKSAE
jgi:dTDP-D-glucose 4,6-dehydratase